MVLTLSTTCRPATDLGYLLHKNPGREAEVDFGPGRALIFAAEAEPDRCTYAVVLELDSVGLVRGEGMMDHYVNDRPYTANSFLSVALARCFGTAMAGTSKERQALADTAIPLTARLSAVRCSEGESLVRRLFEPLGFAVKVDPLPAPAFAEGASLFALELSAEMKVKDFLTALYVLIPVLDKDKHYWVGKDEVDKLLRKGEGWLASHPDRGLIARRYLARSRSLAREALLRLHQSEESADPDDAAEERAQDEPDLEPEGAAGEPPSPAVRLHDLRLEAVAAALAESGARKVLDLGCGTGSLIKLLMKQRQVELITGMDASIMLLERASRRLKLERLPDTQRRRVQLLHSSLTYFDDRLLGHDAAALVEVIEHIDQERLEAVEKIVFGRLKPQTVIVTTPNREYNPLFEGMEAEVRHGDHRFEWTRDEFAAWLESVRERFGFSFVISGIGPVDPRFGAPSQMAVLRRTP